THLRKAFLDGDWNVFAGQYFDNFSIARHVGHSQIEPWASRWISCDWGFKHPACVHWHAQEGTKTVTYRELWGAGKGEQQLAEEIIRLSQGEKIRQFFLSPDAFAKRTSQNTIAEQMSEVLRDSDVPQPSPADNDRVGGARLMHQLLDADLWTIDES